MFILAQTYQSDEEKDENVGKHPIDASVEVACYSGKASGMLVKCS